MFEFRERSGFATFEQKVRVCRVVISHLDAEQTAYVAGLTDAPVLSTDVAAPGVEQLAPSLDQLAAALGRYAVEAGKRSIVVFASGDAEAQRASQGLVTSTVGAKLLPLADAQKLAPTLSTDIDLVVVVTPDVAAMGPVLEGVSDSIPLALVTLSERNVPARDGLLRIVAFAENDPDIDTSDVERWGNFARVAPDCMRSLRENGSKEGVECAPRFVTAALGSDAAVVAGAVLANNEGTATDLQVVERLLAAGEERGSGLLVASHNKFPVVQERNGEQEFLGRF